MRSLLSLLPSPDHSIFRTRSIADLVEQSKGEHALKKVLGPFELIMLGVGAIVGTGIEETSRPVPPDRKKWTIIGFIVGALVVIAALSLPCLQMKPPQGVPPPVSVTVPGTTIIPPAHRTPEATIPASPQITPTGKVTPLPASTPTPTGQATLPPASTPTPGGPPGFTVTVSPTQITAGRGETVTYHMRIETQNGFSEKIHMELVAGVLFFSQTYDLGIQEPPYPKTFEYPFKVPDNLPPGVTVNGVVRSTGGGITRENQLTLSVQ